MTVVFAGNIMQYNAAIYIYKHETCYQIYSFNVSYFFITIMYTSICNYRSAESTSL